MATLHMFEADTPHLDYIERLWAKLDLIDVDFDRGGPPPNSDFARDLAALPAFSGYAGALELAQCAQDHLVSLRQLVGNEPKGFKHWRLHSPWTMLRAAHEMAAQSIWLSSPNDQRTRILRLLQYEWDEWYQDGQTQLKLLNPRKQKTWTGLKDAEADFDRIASPWYSDTKTKNTIKTAPSFSDCVSFAANVSGIVQPRHAVSFWRTASAYAHGRSWANRRVATLIRLPDGSQGWKPDYRVMGIYLTIVMNSFVYALHVAHIRSGDLDHEYVPTGNLEYNWTQR